MATLMLWLFAGFGAITAYCALEAANMATQNNASLADRFGWPMTGMVGLWQAIQPFIDAPHHVQGPDVMMAASLAALAWRLVHGKPHSSLLLNASPDRGRREPDIGEDSRNMVG